MKSLGMILLAKFKFKSKSKEKLRLFNHIETEKNIIGASRIEMLSNREISVDGCRQILEYNDLYVKIKINEGELIITGKSLGIPVFDGSQIKISGVIGTLEFSIR